MHCESFDVVGFDLGHLLQGQMRIGKLKSAYNLLIIGPRSLQCETNLGPLLQGQMRGAELKSAYNLFIIEKCCLSSKLYLLAFSGGYILHLATVTVHAKIHCTLFQI